MNKYISILFRLIPLIMGLVTASYGWFVYATGNTPDKILIGIVLISLAAICIALYTTASTIIRQIIGTYNRFAQWFLPLLGYGISLFTIGCGWYLFKTATIKPQFIGGNIASGIGLIAFCVSTVCLTSSRFHLINQNYERDERAINPHAFSNMQSRFLMLLPMIATAIAFSRAFYLLLHAGRVNSIAGHVVFGLSLICASLIFLVTIVAQQINNSYAPTHKWLFSWSVVLFGAIAIIYGIYTLVTDGLTMAAPGFVLIGLGLICWSISSKIILLTMVWRHHQPNRWVKIARRMPLVPVFTCLTCLFLSAFLFQLDLNDRVFNIPAHVLVGLGCVCFTLFSIVSILESGTSQKK